VSVKVSCPGCGGPIIFKVGSAIVAVCEYCHSVVARGDRKVENLGKVADLVDTGAVLEVGLTGRYQGVPFELTGRAQLGHEAGGVWDEWYAAFADGRWGWLAEAQGKYYLTFRTTPATTSTVPPFTKLQLGQSLNLGAGLRPMLVAEKGQARAVSAEGQIPYRLEPGAEYSYADLSGSHREFATLDYSDEPPLVFAGNEVTLTELGVPETRKIAEHQAREVQGLQLSCPQCGGALALRAPDKTERVGCPNCGALLDYHQGQLKFLQALKVHKPLLPIGSVGKFENQPFTVIGYLKRYVVIERVNYFWEEYLLYHPREGFRWLVRSDNHWSFVTTISPGQVSCSDRRASFQGQEFKLFQKNSATVAYVLGECYWKVAIGEEAQAADYIHPPLMLSREISSAGRSTEVNWSLGTYLPVAELENAFGLKGLPRPGFSTVAPNQPFLHKGIYRSWLILGGLTLIVGVFFLARGSGRNVFHETYPVQPTSTPDQAQVVFSKPFELRGGQNIEISAQANLQNSWLDIEGDLLDEETGVYQSFSLPLEYYSGTDSDGAWTEGSRDGSTHLSALPAGTYTLRLEFQSDKRPTPLQVTVRLAQGVARWPYLLLTLLAVSIIPICVAIYHFCFEKWRWQDSAYSPFHSG